MKKLVSALVLGVFLLSGLTGCDLYQPDVDSMLTPPVLSDLQTEVAEALQDVVGEEYKLCYPAGGSYRSPYIFTDLDSDGEEEAVVFYTAGGEPRIYLLILDKTDGHWRACNALPGTEGEVLYADFRHLSGDGTTDLLVGWRQPDGEYDTLCIYRYGEGALAEAFHISCDGLAIADYDGDGKEELVAATLDGGVTLQLIGWGGSGISVLDSAYSLLRLQSITGSVTGTVGEQLPGTAFYGRVNADMTASLLVGVAADRLVLPQEQNDTGYGGSYCYSGAVPADINNDGVIEVPWSTAAPVISGSDREETRYFTEYRTVQDGIYRTAAVCYQSTSDGWRLILPEALYDSYTLGTLSLKWDAAAREIAFVRSVILLNNEPAELLRLRVVSAADESAAAGYTLLASRGQFSYYALLPAGSPLDMGVVKKCFSLLS